MTEQERQAVTALRKLTEDTINDLEKVITQRDEARAKLTATEAHCVTLRAALEIARGYLPHREDSAEVCYDWCPLCRAEAALAATPAAALHAVQHETIREWCEAIQDEAITSWLDYTPVMEPPDIRTPRDLLKRLLFAAGRDRAVQELRSLCIAPGQDAMEVLSERADEIAKEGK